MLALRHGGRFGTGARINLLADCGGLRPLADAVLGEDGPDLVAELALLQGQQRVAVLEALGFAVLVGRRLDPVAASRIPPASTATRAAFLPRSDDTPPRV